MTTKTADKTGTPPKQTTVPAMQAAYECHTLAQLLYRHIAACYPWIGRTQAPPAFGTPSASMHSAPWPAFGHGTFA